MKPHQGTGVAGRRAWRCILPPHPGSYRWTRVRVSTWTHEVNYDTDWLAPQVLRLSLDRKLSVRQVGVSSRQYIPEDGPPEGGTRPEKAADVRVGGESWGGEGGEKIRSPRRSGEAGGGGAEIETG